MCIHHFRFLKAGRSLFPLLSEGSSNGPACIAGAREAADGEQEGFLNLLGVCVMRVF